MHSNIFFISYGDESNKNAGVYQVVFNTKLSIVNVHSMNAKPGALIVVSECLYVSYKRNGNENGILKFKINGNELSLLDDIKTEYYITSFCETDDQHLILASSFFDGVDLLINIKSGFHIVDVAKHFFTKSTSDPRQQGSHPHHISMIEENIICSVDMGTDTVCFYKLEKNKINKITTLKLEIDTGDGPRILKYNHINKHAYILNEISNSISVYDLDGVFLKCNAEVDTIVRRKQKIKVSNFESNSPSGFELLSNNKFMLVTNRGENSIVLFGIDQIDGSISIKDIEKTKDFPRDVKVINDQILLTCQKSNCIEFFHFENEKLRKCYELGYVLSPVVFNTN